MCSHRRIDSFFANKRYKFQGNSELLVHIQNIMKQTVFLYDYKKWIALIREQVRMTLSF